LSTLFQLINIIGGLGLFLFGMRIMSDGIHKRAGLRMQQILGFLTKNRFLGIFFGFIVTCVIQSSSATTVLLVSLVNAGLISLKQSIGVVMGANIGTTITAWLVSLVGFKVKITAMALPAIAIGFPLHFHKNEKWRDLAEVFTGFGILFLGLSFMKSSVPDIKSNPEVLSFLTNFSNMGIWSVLFFVMVGTILTIVVQSSSAAMAITITMAYKGWITFPVAAGVVLGENIGTTITAYLASLGMNVNAKRTARSHMIFNLIGVVWVLLVFYPFINMVDRFIPGSINDSQSLPIHLSAFHTTFNIINTSLLVWFVPVIARVVTKLVKDKDQQEGIQLHYIGANLPDAVESNLITSRKAVGEMADKVYDLLMLVLNASENGEGKQIQAHAIEEYTDVQQQKITEFLTRCMQEELTERDADIIAMQKSIANELESVADSCYRITMLFNRKERKKLDFHEEGLSKIQNYLSLVLDYLKYNTDYLNYKITQYDFSKALEMERTINEERSRLRRDAQDELYAGADVRGELVFMDIVKHIEHIGDYCFNIAEAIKMVESPDR